MRRPFSSGEGPTYARDSLAPRDSRRALLLQTEYWEAIGRWILFRFLMQRLSDVRLPK